MSATKSRKLQKKPQLKCREAGVSAVEFSLVALIFFVVVFGIIEFARAMYMYNTMAEVTRRAAQEAAKISFNDTAALDLVRKRAVFDETNGSLPFGNPVTYQNIRIEYLHLPAKETALKIIPEASLPSSPARNRVNCMTDPNGSSCIRAVQARICQDGTGSGNCERILYQPLVSLINFPLPLPTALTIVAAETLGFKTGDVPSP